MVFEPRQNYLKKVRLKGYKAYQDGIEYNTNPHYRDQEALENWSFGWLDAERDNSFNIDGASDHGLD